uniref:Uncharacterized protein n=1 Tax=Candidatus Kentrum sp. LPFa TaxID=2126335 RepID=A0A450VMN3_9GAMM|nr:MAG: hypothetical protein BECKLPF1236A_GA0070988_1000115 [Candidatus Kentron sp. LPFa]VFK22683.1 MAG: hypothetical protein BECKLPF1236C_GA0070990_1000136 [Candidatus Kentron sp. LPFa]
MITFHVCFDSRYRKNKNPKEIGACARNPPFGYYCYALICSLNFEWIDARFDQMGCSYSVIWKIFDKTIKKYQGNICHWIPAYQGNDGRVVDENLWFRLCRVR